MGFMGRRWRHSFFGVCWRLEYTILVTATPDDKDLADLQERMQIGRIHRISVSRADAVNAGLIKDGIKCVAWKAEEGSEGMVDFEGTCALREVAAAASDY